MKKQYIGLLIAIVTAYSVGSVGQEFIKPKTKKIYVSEQQDLELDGEIVIAATDMQDIVADFFKTIVTITKSSLTRVNDHVNGEKNGLSKSERTERYAKKMKIKTELEQCVIEMSSMLKRLNEIFATLQE